jgi:HK97 family phage major capsid protein
MPYNSLISRTDMAGLIPVEYTDELLARTAEQSAVLRLARRLRDMPTSTRTMPVISSLPTAYFVSGDTGLKQTTEINWENVTLTAEELAVIVPIPQSALDDSGYPVWDQVKPLIEEAGGLAIDQAVMYGTNIPASWTVAFGAHAGIVALATAHSATVSLAACLDVYDALFNETNGVVSLVEADGFAVTGHIAHSSLKARIRNCRDADGQPIFKSGGNIGVTFATGEIDGAPILYPLNGSVDSAQSLDIAGDWRQLVFAMRKDITYTVATEAVITDAAGTVVYNLFQQDMVALRMVMRLGFALPNPITRLQGTVGSRSPFAVLTA